MRIIIASVVFLALASTMAGCGAAAPEEEGPLGVASSAEIDPGMKSYMMDQAGTTKAGAWAGTISSGAVVEYWVSKSTYSAGAARTFTGASETCASWKSTVCGTGWSGATYYRAHYEQVTLDCEYPPDPCQPPTGATSFLAAGSYQTDDASGAPFAWTYATGQCEYWSMNHTISTGTSTQAPLATGYSSLGDFERSMCRMGTPPATWYTVYYVPVTSFCSTSTC